MAYIPRKRFGVVAEILLAALVVGSVLTLFAVAPGIGPIFKLFEKKKLRPDRKRLREAVSRLRKRRFIITEELSDGSVQLSITKQGREFFQSYQIQKVSIPQPLRWDRKWRIVCFDIPEERKDAREILRNKLRHLGFKQMQKSVFIYPYPCENEIIALAHHLLIKDHVKVFSAENSKNLASFEKMFF